jgi:hypothetical protein
MSFKDNINIKILIISILIFLYLLYCKTNETFFSTTTTTLLGSRVVTYTYTGGLEKWIVPDGITEATFIVVGGNGRNGWGGFQKVVKGGLGAKLTVTIPVIPKQVYDIYVGNNGYCVFNKNILDYPYPDINNCEHLGHSSIPGDLGSGGTSFVFKLSSETKFLNQNLFNGGSVSAIFLKGKPIIIAGGGGAGGGAGSWVFNDYKIIEGHNSTDIVKTSKTISNRLQFGRNGVVDKRTRFDTYIQGGAGGGYGNYKDNIYASGSNPKTLIEQAKGPGGPSLVPFNTKYLKQELADREGNPYISITTKPPSSVS